jgi:hypothetical protein
VTDTVTTDTVTTDTRVENDLVIDPGSDIFRHHYRMGVLT